MIILSNKYLKHTFLSVLSFLSFVFSFSAVAPLSEFNFEQGGYSIIGIRSESDQSSLFDSLGEFITQDISILNEFKNTWKFDVLGHKYACGYHYQVSVCKSGKALKSFWINLNCNEIVWEGNYYYFDNQKLRQFIGRMKRPRELNANPSALREAREEVNKLLKDSNLIFIRTDEWMNYEGQFEFIYEYKNEKESNKDFNEWVLYFERQIKSKYPNDEFVITWRGLSKERMELLVTCNKSLYDKFTLYPVSDNHKWEYFNRFYFTYWVYNSIEEENKLQRELAKEIENKLKLHRADSSLTEEYKLLMSSVLSERHDSILKAFQEHFLQELQGGLLFSRDLDSLSKYVKIVSSPTKMVKFYSFDNYTGGTWHDMTVFVQYMYKKEGRLGIYSEVLPIAVNQAEGENNFTDALIYEVYEVSINGKKNYVTFGLGTHGSGMQHNIVQVFTRGQNGILIKNDSCFADGPDLVIEYPRIWGNVNLSYDKLSHRISYTYKEIIDKKEIEKTMVYLLKNGKYILQ